MIFSVLFGLKTLFGELVPLCISIELCPSTHLAFYVISLVSLCLSSLIAAPFRSPPYSNGVTSYTSLVYLPLYLEFMYFGGSQTSLRHGSCRLRPGRVRLFFSTCTYMHVTCTSGKWSVTMLCERLDPSTGPTMFAPSYSRRC